MALASRHSQCFDDLLQQICAHGRALLVRSRGTIPVQVYAQK